MNNKSKLFTKFKDFSPEEIDKAIEVLTSLKNSKKQKPIEQFLEIISKTPENSNLDKPLDNLRFKQVINSLTTITSEFIKISNTITIFSLTKESKTTLTDKLNESIQLLNNELFHLEANILQTTITPQLDLDFDLEPILCDEEDYTTIAFFLNRQLQNDPTLERKLKLVKLIVFFTLYSLRLENLFLNRTFNKFKIFNYKVGFEINYTCKEFAAVINSISTKPLEIKDDNNINTFSYMTMITIQNTPIDTIQTIINSITKKFTKSLEFSSTEDCN